MEIHERIRQLREEQDLSRKAFGEVLGVSGDVINNIESNRLKRPDQKEPLYKLICEKFKVNYDWLVNGRGEVYRDDDSDAQAIIDSIMTSDDDFAKKTLVKFAKLDERQWRIINDLIDSLQKNL